MEGGGGSVVDEDEITRITLSFLEEILLVKSRKKWSDFFGMKWELLTKETRRPLSFFCNHRHHQIYNPFFTRLGYN